MAEDYEKGSDDEKISEVTSVIYGTADVADKEERKGLDGTYP